MLPIWELFSVKKVKNQADERGAPLKKSDQLKLWSFLPDTS